MRKSWRESNRARQIHWRTKKEKLQSKKGAKLNHRENQGRSHVEGEEAAEGIGKT